jgi:aspartate aminotransferase
MYLLAIANVSLVTGSAFGADNCVRISYAASEADLIEAMNRMKKALGDLA